jgi:hypothetical protein
LQHLIHIGFPKAASTFLQAWFSAHPQIAYAPAALAGYANVSTLIRDRLSTRRSKQLIVTSAEQLSFPHSAIGTWPMDFDRLYNENLAQNRQEICQALADIFPSATILIVTRGFRGWLLSSYSEYVWLGGTQDIKRIIPDWCAGRLWDCDSLIDMYRNAFGGRVILLPYELLAEDQNAFFRELENRLGLPPFALPQGRVNQSMSYGEMNWYARIGRVTTRLPQGPRMHATMLRLARRGWLSGVIKLLESVSPSAAPTMGLIRPDLLATLASGASLLKDESLYRRYADEYLFKV